MNERAVHSIRDEYPVGCRVKLIQMDDPYVKIPAGTLGTVRCVDDIGTVHISWDNGSGLGAIPGIDKIERV